MTEFAVLRPIDPKYHVSVSGEIIKTSNGAPIPAGEPLILFRARDYLSLPLLRAYREMSVADGCTEYHLAGIDNRIAEFERFAHEHPELMKQPGSTRGL
jgi:hypothetical protein